MADQHQSFAEHFIASATGEKNSLIWFSSAGKFMWPEDAVLYHLPQERELLGDRARRLMWQAYLQMAGRRFTNEVAPNADYMSPSGRAPFLCLKLGSHPMIFSDFNKLVKFLEAQNLGVCSNLKSQERADMEAFISLVNTKIIPAMHTIRTHGYSLAWPLNTIVPRLQQARFIWNNCSLYLRSQREVLLDFEQASSALSGRLGASETFFSCGPTTLDAVVYGHFQAVMSVALPSSELAKVVLQFANLRDFCSRTLPRKGLADIERRDVTDKSPLSDSICNVSTQHES